MKQQLLMLLLCTWLPVHAQLAKSRVLALYSQKVERDHVDFAKDALRFYSALATKEDFVFDTTTNWQHLDTTYLKQYQVVVWLNDAPSDPVQQYAFEWYMRHGGKWIGYHVAAYNDKYSNWKWFLDFLGGGMFYSNSWPPLPAKLVVDDRHHPIAKGMPASFKSPLNEWYQWKPSPRLNKHIKVLVSLSPSNYPLGKKDMLLSGDLPVVWTSTQYKMLYLNMGHGDKIFSDSIQNILLTNAMLWMVHKK